MAPLVRCRCATLLVTGICLLSGPALVAAEEGSLLLGRHLGLRLRQRERLQVRMPDSGVQEAWANKHQPGDTALGRLLVSRFEERPPARPMPSQSSLDTAAACPLLIDWPEGVDVTAPDPCGVVAGAWSLPGDGATVLLWEHSCVKAGVGLEPVVTYVTPGGDFFGTSQTVMSLVGSRVEIRDCSGRTQYIISEVVSHEPGRPDLDACETYGSCQGTVWTQLFLYSVEEQLLAKTRPLHLFQSEFDVMDPKGVVIARVSRRGSWSPLAHTCGGPRRRWSIQFSPSPPAAFADPATRWPIAEMLTVLSIRDARRRPSGLVPPSACELERSGLLVVVLVLVALSAVGFAIVLYRVGLQHCRDFFFALENRLCPPRMRRPSKYGGP
mmetsp:Transcript_43188/g.92146  ORF Transcript_43188/g.92146 Transcript_43188/m.92146 type:complete len:383 (-) Transcript_43188:97-1245(-)